MTDAFAAQEHSGGHRGLFITFEGGDGSGKTTQASLLARHLEEQGLDVLHTREPGGTDIGREIRELVLHHRGDIVPRAEALLYAADRAHHIATVVRPALESGTIVLQDRYLDSSVAYQGVGRELDAIEVRELSLWATQGLLPDLTVLLDLDEVDARIRLDAAHKRFDRLEAQGAEFHARVRTAFLALAEVEKSRFFVVNAAEPADRLAVQIAAHVDGVIATHASALAANDDGHRSGAGARETDVGSR